jgi:hypothetical protein
VKISRTSVYQLNPPLARPYYLSGGRLKFELPDSTCMRIDVALRWTKGDLVKAEDALR